MPSIFLTADPASATPETPVIDQEIIEQLENVTVHNILSAIATTAVCLLVIRLFLSLITRAIHKSKMDPQVAKLVGIAVRFVLYFVAVILILSALGIEVTSLVAVLSVIGLAFSLALQNFLSNVAGGIQLFASHPFKAGDWIEAGTLVGCVAEIDLFYTKINTLDNRLVHVPNSVMVTETIYNRSTEPYRRLDLPVSCSYDATPARVLETLRALVCSDPRVLTDRDIFAHVTKYGDSAIEYVVRVWVRNEDYWDVNFYLLDNLKPTLDAAGIEITYPHMNVHVSHDGNNNLKDYPPDLT